MEKSSSDANASGATAGWAWLLARRGVHGFCAYHLRLDTDQTSLEDCVAQVLALRVDTR